MRNSLRFGVDLNAVSWCNWGKKISCFHSRSNYVSWFIRINWKDTWNRSDFWASAQVTDRQRLFCYVRKVWLNLQTCSVSWVQTRSLSCRKKKPGETREKKLEGCSLMKGTDQKMSSLNLSLLSFPHFRLKDIIPLLFFFTNYRLRRKIF